MTKHIHIGTESADKGFDRFIDAWHNAQSNDQEDVQVHLNFEDLSMLLAIITPRRLEMLKALRQQGNMSIRALSKFVDRDYKNVHTDVKALLDVGLIERTENEGLSAPWDVIDAHLSLVA